MSVIFPVIADILAPGARGIASIEHQDIDDGAVAFLRAKSPSMEWETGRRCILRIVDQVYMSDHPHERETSTPAIEHARGRVLVAGLGLGMILHPMAARPEVKSITVVEKFEDVICLVEHSLPAAVWSKLSIVNADILDYDPIAPFDTIFFDIWPSIFELNLVQMAVLHRRFSPHLVRGGWMDSWMRAQLLQKVRNAALSTYCELGYEPVEFSGCGTFSGDAPMNAHVARTLLGILHLLTRASMGRAVSFAKRVGTRIESGEWDKAVYEAAGDLP